MELVLLTVFGRGSIADEHLPGALELAVTDKLHIHAQLVQKVLQKEGLGGEAQQRVGAAVGISH